MIQIDCSWLWQCLANFMGVHQQKNDMTREITYFVLKPDRMGGFVNQKL